MCLSVCAGRCYHAVRLDFIREISDMIGRGRGGVFPQNELKES